MTAITLTPIHSLPQIGGDSPRSKSPQLHDFFPAEGSSVPRSKSPQLESHIDPLQFVLQQKKEKKDKEDTWGFCFNADPVFLSLKPEILSDLIVEHAKGSDGLKEILYHTKTFDYGSFGRSREYPFRKDNKDWTAYIIKIENSFGSDPEYIVITLSYAPFSSGQILGEAEKRQVKIPWIEYNARVASAEALAKSGRPAQQKAKFVINMDPAGYERQNPHDPRDPGVKPKEFSTELKDYEKRKEVVALLKVVPTTTMVRGQSVASDSASLASQVEQLTKYALASYEDLVEKERSFRVKVFRGTAQRQDVEKQRKGIITGFQNKGGNIPNLHLWKLLDQLSDYQIKIDGTWRRTKRIRHQQVDGLIKAAKAVILGAESTTSSLLRSLVGTKMAIEKENNLQESQLHKLASAAIASIRSTNLQAIKEVFSGTSEIKPDSPIVQFLSPEADLNLLIGQENVAALFTSLNDYFKNHLLQSAEVFDEQRLKLALRIFELCKGIKIELSDSPEAGTDALKLQAFHFAITALEIRGKDEAALAAENLKRFLENMGTKELLLATIYSSMQKLLSQLNISLEDLLSNQFATIYKDVNTDFDFISLFKNAIEEKLKLEMEELLLNVSVSYQDPKKVFSEVDEFVRKLNSSVNDIKDVLSKPEIIYKRGGMVTLYIGSLFDNGDFNEIIKLLNQGYVWEANGVKFGSQVEIIDAIKNLCARDVEFNISDEKYSLLLQTVIKLEIGKENSEFNTWLDNEVIKKSEEKLRKLTEKSISLADKERGITEFLSVPVISARLGAPTGNLNARTDELVKQYKAKWILTLMSEAFLQQGVGLDCTSPLMSQLCFGMDDKDPAQKNQKIWDEVLFMLANLGGTDKKSFYETAKEKLQQDLSSLADSGTKSQSWQSFSVFQENIVFLKKLLLSLKPDAEIVSGDFLRKAQDILEKELLPKATTLVSHEYHDQANALVNSIIASYNVLSILGNHELQILVSKARDHISRDLLSLYVKNGAENPGERKDLLSRLAYLISQLGDESAKKTVQELESIRTAVGGENSFRRACLAKSAFSMDDEFADWLKTKQITLPSAGVDGTQQDMYLVALSKAKEQWALETFAQNPDRSLQVLQEIAIATLKATNIQRPVAYESSDSPVVDAQYILSRTEQLKASIEYTTSFFATLKEWKDECKVDGIVSIEKKPISFGKVESLLLNIAPDPCPEGALLSKSVGLSPISPEELRMYPNAASAQDIIGKIIGNRKNLGNSAFNTFDSADVSQLNSYIADRYCEQLILHLSTLMSSTVADQEQLQKVMNEVLVSVLATEGKYYAHCQLALKYASAKNKEQLSEVFCKLQDMARARVLSLDTSVSTNLAKYAVLASEQKKAERDSADKSLLDQFSKLLGGLESSLSEQPRLLTGVEKGKSSVDGIVVAEANKILAIAELIKTESDSYYKQRLYQYLIDQVLNLTKEIEDLTKMQPQALQGQRKQQEELQQKRLRILTVSLSIVDYVIGELFGSRRDLAKLYLDILLNKSRLQRNVYGALRGDLNPDVDLMHYLQEELSKLESQTQSPINEIKRVKEALTEARKKVVDALRPYMQWAIEQVGQDFEVAQKIIRSELFVRDEVSKSEKAENFGTLIVPILGAEYALRQAALKQDSLLTVKASGEGSAAIPIPSSTAALDVAGSVVPTAVGMRTQPAAPKLPKIPEVEVWEQLLLELGGTEPNTNICAACIRQIKAEGDLPHKLALYLRLLSVFKENRTFFGNIMQLGALLKSLGDILPQTTYKDLEAVKKLGIEVANIEENILGFMWLKFSTGEVKQSSEKTDEVTTLFTKKENLQKFDFKDKKPFLEAGYSFVYIQESKIWQGSKKEESGSTKKLEYNPADGSIRLIESKIDRSGNIFTDTETKYVLGKEEKIITVEKQAVTVTTYSVGEYLSWKESTVAKFSDKAMSQWFLERCAAFEQLLPELAQPKIAVHTQQMMLAAKDEPTAATYGQIGARIGAGGVRAPEGQVVKPSEEAAKTETPEEETETGASPDGSAPINIPGKQ